LRLNPEIFVSVNDDLDLATVRDYPVLAGVLDRWHPGPDGRPPAAIDPLDLPPSALPYLMLVDLVGTEDAVIRLAGTAACDIYGRELKGTSVHEFFGPGDASDVLSDLNDVARSEAPKLTRRSYVSINGKPWSYVRLLLPLRPEGEGVTRILKALEPEHFAGPDA